jgi:hypothetical protein
MILAIEDALSEAVATKLVAVLRPDIAIASIVGKRGKGHIRKRCRELNRTAASLPVFVIVDQDSPHACPVELIKSWLGGPPQPMLIFRFAVMEIESWVLADRVKSAHFLGVPLHRIPQNPDSVTQPKEALVHLARSSRLADIRADLVPPAGATAAVGPAYSARLSNFVLTSWDPIAGAEASESLARTVIRLQSL